MKLVFNGFESAFEIEKGVVSTMQIEPGDLFARVVRSVSSGQGEFALEPYSFWNGESREKPNDAVLFVPDPLNLPWDDRSLLNVVVKRMEREFLEDEDLRQAIETATEVLSSKIVGMGLGFESNYGFATDWDFKRYLKSFAFGVTIDESVSYLDNLLNFLSLALDAGCEKVITFVNLKTFLTKNELDRLFEHIFYLKLRVLLLENKVDIYPHDYERKYRVDLDFIEN